MCFETDHEISVNRLCHDINILFIFSISLLSYGAASYPHHFTDFSTSWPPAAMLEDDTKHLLSSAGGDVINISLLFSKK